MKPHYQLDAPALVAAVAKAATGPRDRDGYRPHPITITEAEDWLCEAGGPVGVHDSVLTTLACEPGCTARQLAAGLRRAGCHETARLFDEIDRGLRPLGFTEQE